MMNTQEQIASNGLVGTKYVIAAGVFLLAGSVFLGFRVNTINERINAQTEHSQHVIYNNMYEVQKNDLAIIRSLATARTRADI